MRAPSYASLDDALETLSGNDTALKNGNSNHAPMVAEALCAMGRPDAVMPWLARYRDRMLPRPPAGERILREDWRSALGERNRFTEWAVFFGEELQEAAWSEVLDRWVARLAPGFCAATTRGLLPAAPRQSQRRERHNDAARGDRPDSGHSPGEPSRSGEHYRIAHNAR